MANGFVWGIATGVGVAAICLAHPLLVLTVFALWAACWCLWRILCLYAAALKIIGKGVLWFEREWRRTG